MQTKTGRASGFISAEIICVIVIVGVLAAIAMPNFGHGRTTAPQNACINSLRQIDGAKEQWALENGKTNGPVNKIDVLRYMKRIPSCPSGGTYTYGVISVNPTCSLSTLTEGPHLLP